jgi:acetyl-CoA acetyltransferase
VTLRDKACIVGIGTTAFYRRGQSGDRTPLELMCEATKNATDDAGIEIGDIDGFSYYSGGYDSGLLASALGIEDLKYSVMMTGGGGGSQGTIVNAAAAVAGGLAEMVLCVKALKQGAGVRIGQLGARARLGRTDANGAGAGPDADFYIPYGLMSPGQGFALMARQHMHRYGTTTQQFGAVAVSTRFHASRNPAALYRDPITLEDHQNSRMIADPLRLFDFCLETDGGTALLVTTPERAKDLRQKPVSVMAGVMGGAGRFGQGIFWHQMPDDYYPSSGHRLLAPRLYSMAGVGPGDIDVAELYDHFTPMVIAQIEDYGFCKPGEGGPFVEDGGLRFDTGRLPVNTHGGNLSEVYLLGLTHTIEAVRQLRGTSSSQVEGAEIALVSSGPGILPTSGIILRG